MKRTILAVAALALLAAPNAWAGGQNNTGSNPQNGVVTKHHPNDAPIQPNGPTVSTALGTALSVGGTTPTVNTNQIVDDSLAGKHTAPQVYSAPAVQAGVAVGVAIDGNASAQATNTEGH